MIELIGFVVLCLLSVLTIISESRELLRYLYVPALLIFLVIVRLNAFVFHSFEIDILTYALEMHATSFDFYYLREFVFWFGLRFIYYMTQSELFSFIFLDFFWVYILLKTLPKESARLGKGLILILATSFPFFFGYENIYRQFYATVVLLYSYSLIEIKPNRSFYMFIISVFIHNLSLFLVPLFIIRKCYTFNIQDRIVLSSIVSGVYIFSLPFIMSFKDADPTEIDLSYLYLLLFIFTCVLFFYKFKNNVLSVIRLFPSLLPASILIIGFVFHGQEMIAERLGMMFIPFLLYDFYLFSNTIIASSKRRLFRLTLFLVFSIPVLMFSSSMIFFD